MDDYDAGKWPVPVRENQVRGIRGFGRHYFTLHRRGLRAVLYGLHAILRLHTVQEDETYLSLGDSTDAVTV